MDVGARSGSAKARDRVEVPCQQMLQGVVLGFPLDCDEQKGAGPRNGEFWFALRFTPDLPLRFTPRFAPDLPQIYPRFTFRFTLRFTLRFTPDLPQIHPSDLPQIYPQIYPRFTTDLHSDLPQIYPSDLP